MPALTETNCGDCGADACPLPPAYEHIVCLWRDWLDEEKGREENEKSEEEEDSRVVVLRPGSILIGWCQDNGNRANQESKFDFVATRQCLMKIEEGQQKIKIIRTNRQSNLRGFLPFNFHPRREPTVFIHPVFLLRKSSGGTLLPPTS